MAFNPDDGPARIFRYSEVMPLRNMLTMFFPRQNLLIISKEHWEALSDEQRHRVLRTEEKVLEVSYPPNKPPVITARDC